MSGSDEIKAPRLTQREIALERELTALRRRFDQVADGVPAAIVTVDDAGACSWANRARLEFAGRELEAEIGVHWLADLHPDDREAAVEVARQCAASRMVFTHEVRRQRFDGEWRWLLEKGMPILDEQDSFRGLLVTSVDITGRRAIEEEYRRARLAAEAASRTKSEFLANMSHEIRTPLTAILGFSEELRMEADRGALSSEAAVAVGLIDRNGRHLLELINDILDISKIEAGKLELEKRTIRLRHFVGDLHSLFEPRAVERGLSFEKVVDAAVPERIVVDALRLRQILVNLIGNALKFTSLGGVTLRVGLGECGTWIVFEVIDTGIGIKTTAAAHLFEAFSQADETTTRRFGGTGLGLAISRRLAEMMGGRLDLAHSDLGVGSTFRVEIPMQIGSSAMSISTTATSRRAVNVAPDLTGRRLLLVEDNPTNRLLITRIVERAGLEVVTAADGRSGVDVALEARAAGRPFDVVLMDMQMPIMDGLEATRTLRAAEFDVPIVALTASAMSEDRDRCLASGCNEFAIKPVDRGALYTILERLLA